MASGNIGNGSETVTPPVFPRAREPFDLSRDMSGLRLSNSADGSRHSTSSRTLWESDQEHGKRQHGKRREPRGARMQQRDMFSTVGRSKTFSQLWEEYIDSFGVAVNSIDASGAPFNSFHCKVHIVGQEARLVHEFVFQMFKKWDDNKTRYIKHVFRTHLARYGVTDDDMARLQALFLQNKRADTVYRVDDSTMCLVSIQPVQRSGEKFVAYPFCDSHPCEVELSTVVGSMAVPGRCVLTHHFYIVVVPHVSSSDCVPDAPGFSSILLCFLDPGAGGSSARLMCRIGVPESLLRYEGLHRNAALVRTLASLEKLTPSQIQSSLDTILGCIDLLNAALVCMRLAGGISLIFKQL